MRYAPEMYARALIAVLDAAPEARREKTLKRFLSVVEKYGDTPRMEGILKALEEMVTRRAGGRMVELEFARPASEELVEELKKSFSSADRVKISIHPRMIAGVRIVIDGARELDQTLERKLKQMFVS